MSKTTDSDDIMEDVPTLTEIDKLIHQPNRLLIMSHLYVVKEMDMIFLRNQTGLTWGNLSSHVSKLEEENLVEVEKKFEEKTPKTILSLSKKGRKAFEEYRNKLSQILRETS